MDDCVEYFLQRYKQNKESYYDNFFEDKFKYIEQLKIDKTSEFWLKYGNCSMELKPYFERYCQPPYTKSKVSLFNFVFKQKSSNIFKECVRSAVDFKKMLQSYNFHENIFMKEYTRILYGTMFLFLGNVVNFPLLEAIMRLWTIVDNIKDEDSLKYRRKDLKNITKFFANHIYRKDNKIVTKFMYKHRNDIFINIILDIYAIKNINHELFFDRVNNLFRFSYGRDELETDCSTMEEILTSSSKKSSLTFSLFRYCMKRPENDKFDENFHALTTQLWDDIDDLEEDILNRSKTIFTVSSRLDRSILFITLLEITIEKVGIYDNYLFLTPFLFVQEKHLFHRDLTDIVDKTWYTNVVSDIKTKMHNFLSKETIDQIICENLLDEIDEIDIDIETEKEFIERFKLLTTTDSNQSESYSVSEV